LDNDADVCAYQAQVSMQNRLGVPSRMLSHDEAAQMVPLLNTADIMGGAYHARDGLADPSGVVQGYAAGARRRGVQLLTGVEVIGIRVQAGKVTGVQTSQGAIDAPVVVNAAGPWAGQVAAMAGVQLPISPVRRQIAVTTPLPDVPADFPFVIDFSRNLYFHREGRGVLTGQSNVNEPPGFNQSVDHNWTEQHLDNAIFRFPLLAKAGLLREWAGLYEVTPDAHPVIDRLADPLGFYVVAGFSGHGFMHGPAAGLLMSELILDGQARSLDIQQLRLSRFAEGDLVKEHNVV